MKLQNTLLNANENCRFNSCFIALKSCCCLQMSQVEQERGLNSYFLADATQLYLFCVKKLKNKQNFGISYFFCAQGWRTALLQRLSCKVNILVSRRARSPSTCSACPAPGTLL